MSETGMLYTAAFWQVKPGNEAAFIRAWQDFAKWTAERVPGALTGRLLQDMNDAALFQSFGPWDSIESAAAWRQRPEFKAFFVLAKELCVKIEPHTLVEVAASDVV